VVAPNISRIEAPKDPPVSKVAGSPPQKSNIIGHKRALIKGTKEPTRGGAKKILKSLPQPLPGS